MTPPEISTSPTLLITEYVKVTPAGIITTVAGNGMIGSSGDGGPANEASIGLASGLAVDAAGNLYIADQGNQRIRKVSPDGTITTVVADPVAGEGKCGFSGNGGPASDATVCLSGFLFSDGTLPSSQYSGLALDSAGNLYIADTGTTASGRWLLMGRLLRSPAMDLRITPAMADRPVKRP